MTGAVRNLQKPRHGLAQLGLERYLMFFAEVRVFSSYALCDYGRLVAFLAYGRLQGRHDGLHLLPEGFLLLEILQSLFAFLKAWESFTSPKLTHLSPFKKALFIAIQTLLVAFLL